MFRDAKEELQRLEAELLAQERPDIVDELDELLEEEPVQPVYRNFSNNYGQDLRNYASGYKAYNADSVDTDLEEYSDEIAEEPREKPLTGLVLTACGLTLGILLVMLYWVFRMWGA